MDKGGNGVNKKNDGIRICVYGCSRGKKLLNKDLYLCSVPLVDCERDGINSLSLGKDGGIMG